MIVNLFLSRLKKKESDEGRRITYSDVREATGIAESTLSAWANNTVQRYDRDVLEKLCLYFDCKPGDLIVIKESSVN